MSEPSFDLWQSPWIRVRDATGSAALLGLRQTLSEAHRWRDLADPSPIVAVSIHRLLVAILQDALKPRSTTDLARLWREPGLPREPLDAFALEYADRFELFSPDRPFLQSADFGLAPSKKDKVKSVLTLYPDWPSGGESTHFRHGREVDGAMCPVCAASGLVLQSSFAAAGGRGIGPSINGAPPLYVLPQGETLAQSLKASLISPDYYPTYADQENDLAWWRHGPVIKQRHFVARVGYVHSLTFPARQTRLHPASADGQPCVRCGTRGEWVVRTMVYNMGETRVGASGLWQDPFLAYKVPRDTTLGPLPLRPRSGRALWRDYGALFLEAQRDDNPSTFRPKVLAQIDAVAEAAALPAADTLRVRCVGMRTDQAKVFEWVDEGLEVPLALLHSREAAIEIENGLSFSERLQSDLLVAWSEHIEGRLGRYRTERTRMLDSYWSSLAPAFDRYALSCAAAAQDAMPEGRDHALAGARREWARVTAHTAQRVFEEATSALGDIGVTLRMRIRGEAHCRRLVTKHRKEFAPDDD